MKKLFALLISCVLLGSLFACGAPNPVPEATPEPAEETVASEETATAAYEEALAALNLAEGEEPPECYAILYYAPTKDFTCVFTESWEEAEALCPVNDPATRPDAMWEFVWECIKPDPFCWTLRGFQLQDLLPQTALGIWSPEEIAAALDSSFAICNETYVFRFITGDCKVTFSTSEGDATWHVSKETWGDIEVRDLDTMPKVDLFDALPADWQDDGEIYFFVNNLLSGSYRDGIWYTTANYDPVDGHHVKDKTYYLGDALKKSQFTLIHGNELLHPTEVIIGFNTHDNWMPYTAPIRIPALLKSEYYSWEEDSNLYFYFVASDSPYGSICVTANHDPRPREAPQEDAVSQADWYYVTEQYPDVESITAYKLDMDQDGIFEERLLVVERDAEDWEEEGVLFLDSDGTYSLLDLCAGFGGGPGIYDLNGDGYCELLIQKGGSSAGYARFSDGTWGEIFYAFTSN